jgi:hypothetical protein
MTCVCWTAFLPAEQIKKGFLLLAAFCLLRGVKSLAAHKASLCRPEQLFSTTVKSRSFWRVKRKRENRQQVRHYAVPRV